MAKMELLEGCIRGELDKSAWRAFAVVEPLKVTIVNHPGGTEEKKIDNHPMRPEEGQVPTKALILPLYVGLTYLPACLLGPALAPVLRQRVD
jgi:hypothetical protein